MIFKLSSSSFFLFPHWFNVNVPTTILVNPLLAVPGLVLGDCIRGSWRWRHRRRWRPATPPQRTRRCSTGRPADSGLRRTAGTLTSGRDGTGLSPQRSDDRFFFFSFNMPATYPQPQQNQLTTRTRSLRQTRGRGRRAAWRGRRTAAEPERPPGGCWRSGPLGSWSAWTPGEEAETLWRKSASACEIRETRLWF